MNELDVINAYVRVGYFWSGCAGEYKRGLEITGIGVIDVDNQVAQGWNPYGTWSLTNGYSERFYLRNCSVISGCLCVGMRNT